MGSNPLQQPYWLRSDDAPHDVVLSTRYRLARNLHGVPFPSRADAALREVILDRVGRAFRYELPHWRLVRADQVSPLMREVFFEKHLISTQLKDHPDGSMICFSPEGRFSVMVNEEDHLRFQFLLPGFQLRDSWRELLEVESRIERWVDFAFHEQFGYLTSCLTNVGTGLRASVMLHLPALSWTGSLPSTINLWPDQAVEFRGLFGEGSSMNESFLQLSNKTTLGADLETFNHRVLHSAEKLIMMERRSREQLLSRHRLQLEDTIFRALATLGAARIMTSSEATAHLSMVRLGACLGLLNQFPPMTLLRLLVGIRPAHLQLEAQRPLDPDERDEWRATYIRSQIEHLVEDKSDG